MGFAAVALLGVLPGIVVAVLASLLALIRRAYRPRISVLGRVPDEASADENYRFRSIDRHPEYETIPGLVLFRFSNELFFANASYFRDETLRLVDEADPPARTVLVDASVISHADTTALAMLDDLLDQLELRGVTLEFARARADLTELLDRAGISDRIGPDAFHRSVHAGVESFLAPVAAAPSSDSRPLARLEHPHLGRRRRARRIACSNSGAGVLRNPGGPRSPRWTG